ncbi:hypothetical protein [Peribacillus tepidiphilus]|uniref:hypothetical protein n=1 Tax=Peribacillus tepidiphilus TaxID=2652445 RepID=UPI001291B357|nr:hypothetical protein [Peribacillus tepidiphilus]
MDPDKNVTIRSELKEKGHIKIKVTIQDGSQNHELILGVHNFGDAIKRQLILAWALNKDFFDCIEHSSDVNDLLKFKPRRKFILFEEPEAFAHPSAIRLLRDELYRIAKEM